MPTTIENLKEAFAGESQAKSLSKNKLVNSDLVEWYSSIQETICADVN